MRGRSPAPVAVRAADADRDRAVERLGQACAEGRITLDELDERSGAAYGARTVEELERLLADVPRENEPAPPAPTARRDWVVAALGSKERRGTWRVGPRTVALSLLGSNTIDLRNAVLEGGPVTVRTIGVLGSVEVLVPPGVPVTVGGTGILGSVTRYGLSRDRPTPGVPHVHIEATAFLGSVQVRRVRPRRQSWFRRGG